MQREWSFPAEPRALSAIRRQARIAAEACGLDEEAVGHVALAVSEAATNAIVHAYRHAPGEIRLRVARTPDELVVIVADDGPGLAPRLDSPGLGLGLPIIADVATSMRIVAEGAGTEIHMSFPCGDGLAA